MKIAFIIPWYGQDITGGAETEAKMTAEMLNNHGIGVEVLTTCVKNFQSDWNQNYYPEGVEEINGVTVKRFKVRKRNTAAFDKINYLLMNYQPISAADELIFIDEMINSPALYAYIKNNSSKYDFLFFIPYMFGTTYYGSLACPEKSILIPCLHDESYARLTIYKKMFSSARGIIFLADAEKRLAHELYDLSHVKCEVLGGGIDTKFVADGERFKEKYGVDCPFILYAGRKESGKNSDLLVEYFSRYLDHGNTKIKLILIGPGQAEIPNKYKDVIIDLGYIPKQDKYDAYSAATIFCNPSVNESFSIVIMESWLCRVPVLVNAACDVTKDHCIISNAGLYFTNYDEFEECILFYLKNDHLRRQMGENGRSYVLKNYSWDIIVKKYVDFMKKLGQ